MTNKQTFIDVIQNAGGDGAFVERLLTKIEKDKIKEDKEISFSILI